ncbi:hypothetical protein PoB_002878200 [Plakobranchus ocellatus]|uniref:Uncharacterized protein n=1 Tax=Plakobranchus ocellatus TaxID=259542 RepID=A0AAV4A5Z3_9GAST|nr:hypothetical protein PoB_002878200 [Plakobranchus ocellatus]
MRRRTTTTRGGRRKGWEEGKEEEERKNDNNINHNNSGTEIMRRNSETDNIVLTLSMPVPFSPWVVEVLLVFYSESSRYEGQGAVCRARTRDRKVPADPRADSLATVPPRSFIIFIALFPHHFNLRSPDLLPSAQPIPRPFRTVCVPRFPRDFWAACPP